MDRERLKDIQTSDLSESNVNEDFVLWLKTKGPTYLLVIMVVIVGYLFFIQHQASKSQRNAEAWVAFAEARVSGLPASFEDIATSYSDVDGLRPLGLLSAADGYLKAIVLGQTIGSDSNVTSSLSDDDRNFYLQKADALYGEVVSTDNGDASSTLFVVGGLNGQAAVAEVDGDIDSARTYYKSVITRAGDQFPALASQAQRRIDSLESLSSSITLPTEEEVTASNNQVLKRDPKVVDSDINALISPK
ncbi:MAG: hypothetical protein QF444_00570 [Phycisphaerales bacterium]|jgi:hypothetical protein|nr:hypothetical protein [Phycisphaerales bacterium]MDP6692792.1 hypothetical protein [Phycisphaerales bacterium]